MGHRKCTAHSQGPRREERGRREQLKKQWRENFSCLIKSMSINFKIGQQSPSQDELKETYYQDTS